MKDYFLRKDRIKLFLFFSLLVVSVYLINIFIDPDLVLSGLSMASMMVIGDIEDVSDRQTHGSNIAYQVHLIPIEQIDTTKPFPKPNASREVAQIPMKDGEYMRYFEAHDIPTFTGSGEKGDITTSGTNTFSIIMGGIREKLLNFQEEYAGGKFIILFHEIGETDWYILGSVDRPMIFSSFENKNDKDGRYVTFTFTRTSIDQYYKYTGTIVRSEPVTHSADATALTIKSGVDTYKIPAGSSGTYAISTVNGITSSDKGRYITLEGTATDEKAATIADSTSFVLEDGTTWTAKAGSRITFRVFDSQTLVEVSGSRVQTA
jgi:hypothetical protein